MRKVLELFTFNWWGNFSSEILCNSPKVKVQPWCLGLCFRPKAFWCKCTSSTRKELWAAQVLSCLFGGQVRDHISKQHLCPTYAQFLEAAEVSLRGDGAWGENRSWNLGTAIALPFLFHVLFNSHSLALAGTANNLEVGAANCKRGGGQENNYCFVPNASDGTSSLPVGGHLSVNQRTGRSAAIVNRCASTSQYLQHWDVQWFPTACHAHLERLPYMHILEFPRDSSFYEILFCRIFSLS